MMEDKFVDVNGIPTRIRTWGKSLNEKFEKNEIILFVSGNPGITGFYITFLTTIFNFFQGQTPVWAIGQGGHDEPDDESIKIPALRSNKHLYSLNGQINHKVEFIRKYIPSDVRIHLVGHSIGAYISLQLLKFDDISKRVHHCYLLFPTLEYMADTPNGKLYIWLLQKPFSIVFTLLKLLALLPLNLREIILIIFCWIRSFPQEFIPWLLMVLRPTVMSKLVHMSDEEMEKLKEPDYDLMKQNEKRLTFFYSTTDGWAPLTHYERLVTEMPNAKAQATDKFEHTFVKKSSCEMGFLLGEWIQQNAV